MSSYLLDSNVFSEAVKPKPSKGLTDWLRSVSDKEQFTSCLVIGEVAKGVELARSETQKRRLREFVDNILDSYEDRVLPLDIETCRVWAVIFAAGQKTGKTPPFIDSLLAAQAIQHDLTLVTRNTKDFEQFTDLKILNPWLA